MQSSSDPASFHGGIARINNSSNARGQQQEDDENTLHNRRRDTNPFLSSWLPPSLSHTTSPLPAVLAGQDQDQRHLPHPLQFGHQDYAAVRPYHYRPVPLQDPLLPSFAFSLSSSFDFAVAGSSVPSASSSAFSTPSSLKTRNHRNNSRVEQTLQGSSSFQRPVTQMSDQRPSLTTHSTSSSQSSSKSSPFASSSNPFMYTPYQPPPTREQQQQQQQSLPSSSILGQSRLSLGNAQWLDPEPVSPGASTLVGSPVTPRFDSQSGRFPWRTPTTTSSMSSPYQHQHPSPQYPAPTFRFSHFADTNGSMDDSQSSTGGGAGLGAATAARSLAYFDQGAHHSHPLQLQIQPSWEPHVSVPMDEISLDSFSPSDDGNLKKYLKNQRPPLDGVKNRDGTWTPQSAFGQSSSASVVTLLAGGQQTPFSSSSSSRTLFGSLLKSKNSFHRLNDLKATASDIAQQKQQQQQHQNSATGPDGKMYSKKPRAKTFGKKINAGGGGGGGGNGDRKALFSNERTFMHWIKFGILLGTTALTLCNFGALDSLAFNIGVTILVIAMSSLGYAATMFHRRDRSLERRLQSTLAKKQGQGKFGGGVRLGKDGQIVGEICYYDRLGPTILCSTLLFAYSLNFYLSIMRASSTNSGGMSFFRQE